MRRVNVVRSESGPVLVFGNIIVENQVEAKAEGGGSEGAGYASVAEREGSPD